ncbi:hypothetical protein NI939_31470, partial [Streptomyces sp. RKCA-744]|nr:hypothetical protein [Streptomyces sp. RKCA744]
MCPAHPGLVATDIYDRSPGLGTTPILRLLAQGPEDGALPVVHATTGNLPGEQLHRAGALDAHAWRRR